MTVHVGVLGFGSIGRAVAEHIADRSDAELAFVWARGDRPVRLDGVDRSTTSLSHDLLDGVDLVVEAAAPAVVADHGAKILTCANLLLVSTGALADDVLHTQLTETARAHGHRLLVTRGALVGLDALAAGASTWQSVRITFVKPPSSIEPPPSDTGRCVVLYDGPARGVAEQYPRNVNAMVTCALATTGLDRTRAVLISDPSRSTALLDIEAIGRDGSTLTIRREQPVSGVSGTEMGNSILASLQAALGGTPDRAFM